MISINSIDRNFILGISQRASGGHQGLWHARLRDRARDIGPRVSGILEIGPRVSGETEFPIVGADSNLFDVDQSSSYS